MLGGASLIRSGFVPGYEVNCIRVKRGASCGKGAIVGVMELPESHEAVDRPHAHASSVPGVETSHVRGCRVFRVFRVVDGGLSDFCLTFPSGEYVKVGIDGCGLKDHSGPNVVSHGGLPPIGLTDSMDALSL